uniref:PRELI/MSF1 domain-containing protein n=1 Tax=Felis catus TaxID=9685 RepID=A0ABI7Z7J8_FELCA
MVKYFLGQSVLRSSWDQVFAAFWQRYPNPYSKHVLTEDIVHREVTPDQKLLSRRLLTKTNRMPRWAERLFPANVAHSVYILEDSIVDPQNQTMTTFTWNINHARLMVVEERCVYCVNSDNSGWTEIRREAWVSSSLFGVSRAVQEFGLARFKSNVTKTMKGFEYILAKLQGEGSGHKEKLESSPSCPDLCGVCGYHHPTLSLGLLISPLGQIPPFQWGLAQRG